MKRTRQLHLWIGLICSIFILLQSVTGLLLSEKQLFGLAGGMGGGPPQEMNGGGTSAAAADMPSKQTGSDQAASGSRQPMGDTQDSGMGRGGQGGQQGMIGLIKGLHEGKIGQTDVRWLVDLGALGMIVLTVTGIVLSMKTLRAQSIQRKRRTAAVATS
ncbi:PepSY-associated TM helix domain-containing protein [Paenibacillus aestuarii]|uniref:PepSY-associated TM helix domain-containing protein n=1 Tax=Paenibacillus aestuarii TaxID=516965 RepID=UPI0022E9BFDE|nr:PepSY-associated TM helix domain-containing protein [Paenibacillus aestuarii]